MTPRTYAVVLAAGSGSRLGADMPKQFCTLAGRSVLDHAFDVLDRHPAITDMVLVVPEKMTPEQSALVARIGTGARKPTQVVAGGGSRNRSTRAALACIADPQARVLIHDAARPLLGPDIISRCVAALAEYEAVDTVIECADTVVEVDGDDCIAAVPDRSRLRRGQTPQAFRADLLRDAYDAAEQAGDLDNSDDCGVVLRFRPDVAIKCVRGSDSNLKITRPIDLATADRLFQLRSSAPPPVRAPSAGARSALAGKVVVVFGSSSGIGAEIARRARAAGARVSGFSLSDGGVDVRSGADVARALAQAEASHGPVDAVINAAGLLVRGVVDGQDLSVIRASLDTNLFGAFVVARHALARLSATRGHLLFFTSSSYTRGRATYAAYSAAKAGLVNMVQALADEAAAAGIKVNCISPERTATRMRAQAFPDEDPSGLLQAGDVAEAALALLATEMTGQVVDVKRSPTAGDARVPDGDRGRPDAVRDPRTGSIRPIAKRAVAGRLA